MTRLFLSPPHMSGRERDYVNKAFDSNYVAPAGPMIGSFETAVENYTGIPHAVALTSGTAAIHLALKSLDLSVGDEVWASSLTFIGSVAPVLYERLTPVFIDSSIDDWTLDVNMLAENLHDRAINGKLPKALIPTDIYGQSCDLDEILRICNSYDIPVIADSAEAIGARYKDRHAGAGAYATAFSFNGNKIITTSGGGLLASHNEKVIDRARFLSTQARESFVHYQHLEVGYNYRMSNICAAIGCGQIEVLDERVNRRRDIFELYKKLLEELPGISFMPEPKNCRSTRWLSVICIEPGAFGSDRETVRLVLEANDIESRPVWKPMHMQPVFVGAEHFGGKVSETLFAQGLCLPSGSQMSDDDVVRVSEVLIAMHGKS